MGKGRRKLKSILELYGQQRIDEVRNSLKEGEITQIALANGINRRSLYSVLNGNSSRLDLFLLLDKHTKNVQEPTLSYVGTEITIGEYKRFKALFRALQYNDKFKLYICWKTGKDIKKVKVGIPYWFDSICFPEFLDFCGKRPKLVNGKVVFDSGDLVSTVVELQSEIDRLKGLLSGFGLE